MLKSTTLGDITATQLTKHPGWYFKLKKSEKVICNNILWSEGRYFDIEDNKIKQIPSAKECKKRYISKHYDLIIIRSTAIASRR